MRFSVVGSRLQICANRRNLRIPLRSSPFRCVLASLRERGLHEKVGTAHPTPFSVVFGSVGRYNRRMDYRYTEYFEKQVLQKRPYLKKEWCVRVIENSIRVEKQENNRFRFWGVVEELGGVILRVVTLEDKRTIHNAFPDRRFKR